MRILPNETVKYRTRLELHEAIEKLSEVTAPKDPSKFNSPLRKQSKPYQGLVSNVGFTLLRNIDYRNSFRPIIYGKFKPGTNYLEIDVQMKMHRFVRFFMIFWLSGVSFAFVASTYGVIRDSSPGFAMVLPVVMLLAGYFISKIAFGIESRQSTADLQKFLNAEIVKV